MKFPKSSSGWSDVELLEYAHFDLQVGHALGLHDLQSEMFTDQTLHNSQHRVLQYAAEKSINLYMSASSVSRNLTEFGVDVGGQRVVASR